MTEPDLPLAGLVGLPAREAVARLGPPETDRRVGSDRWLVFRSGDTRLRVRCRREAAPGEERDRVASWTASFGGGRETLRGAAEPLGLWPAAAPDARPGEGPLLRRCLRSPSGVVRSLTAEGRGGRIERLTVWEELPEWSEGEGERTAPVPRARPDRPEGRR